LGGKKEGWGVIQRRKQPGQRFNEVLRAKGTREYEQGKREGRVIQPPIGLHEGKDQKKGSQTSYAGKINIVMELGLLARGNMLVDTFRDRSQEKTALN